MYTKSAKGQGIIGEIILFSVTIVFSLALFFVLSSDGGTQFEESTSVKVEDNMESIRHRSILTAMLNDKVWRATGVSNRYDDVKAIELTSYYLSTDEEIHLNNNSYGQSQVKNDLETYYNYKMRKNFLNTPQPTDYALNISYNDKHIDVENIEDRRGSWSSIEVPMQLSDNRIGTITMWVKGSGGVFQVE